MANYKTLLTKVDTLVFDYDGVMTDGRVILMDEGHPLRSANVKDGYVLQLLVKLGFNVVIMSGGFSRSMENRFEMLGVKDVFLGTKDKKAVLEKYLSERNIDPKHVVYMGDDIPDYYVMKMVGIPVCPADASEEIKAISIFISDKKGGEGCVRDIVEQVLKIQGKWMSEEAYSW
jgi:3-deoxy-D-manno-octulosonate 8-phosphate phosphatase (KDO 8-P phosphatase)